MMKRDEWQRAGRFWAGAGCAVLWSWLALALCGALLARLHFGFSWGALVALPLGVLALLAILFGAGVFASYFWVAVADSRLARWSEGAVGLILSPLLWFGWWGAMALMPAFLLAIVPFHGGLEYGEDCWAERRWRHLFGLANEWEREQDEFDSS